MDRRRPGQSKFTTQRQEPDTVEILSGVFEGKTTGTPISLLIRNQDAKSKDYRDIKDKFRPGHADYTYYKNMEYPIIVVVGVHPHVRRPFVLLQVPLPNAFLKHNLVTHQRSLRRHTDWYT